MHFPTLFTALLAVSPAASNTLYAAVADGTIKTLALSGSSLSVSSSLVACGANPSWLTLSPNSLYCSNEGTPGSLSTFDYSNTGFLTLEASVATTGGDVSSVIYGDGKFVALAHYGRNSISTYQLPITNSSVPLQNLTLQFPGPGPNPRQNTGYPHQVILDPSGQFLFSPDLGADLVRVFSINNASGTITQVSEIKLEPGSGPRHAAFYSKGGKTFVYVVSELSNKLSGYSMNVNSNTNVPTFTQIFASMLTVPEGTNISNVALAEVRVSGNTLTVSNRGAANFGPGLDSLSVYTIGGYGQLSNRQLFSSGGNFPRSFEISEDGTMVAVGNQKSQSVTILNRDVATGSIGPQLANLNLGSDVIDVIWG